MPSKPSQKTPPQPAPDEGPAMPFNEALKRVWSAPPAPKVKARQASSVKKAASR